MGRLLSQPSSQASHWPLLEGVRGLAVLLVVLSHMSGAGVRFHPDLNFRGLGTYGVILFFVLSAYLLTRRFLNRRPEPLTSGRYWLAYAVRRVSRIYPLFTLVLLTAAVSPVISTAIAGPSPFSFTRHFFLQDGHKILWTVPVEMKFYALLPFLLTGLGGPARGATEVGELRFCFWCFSVPP